MSRKYKFGEQEGAYFVSFAIVAAWFVIKRIAWSIKGKKNFLG